jgi:Flp pilus assembly pilin Flp
MKRQSTTLSSRSIGQHLVDFWQETTGAVAIEYGLIAALIVLAILGTIDQLGDTLFGLPLQLLVNAFTGALS